MLGNSVARHWAFVLAAILLDGVTHPQQMSSTSREMEKERCGRGGAWGGLKKTNSSSSNKNAEECYGACACDFNVRSRLGPSATLLFKWNFHVNPSDTLGIDFADLMTSGVPERVIREDSTSWRSPAIAPPDVLIYNAFRNHRSAPILAAQVTRALNLRPSLRFYWRATTALCDSNVAKRADQNEKLCKLNERIERLLCAEGGGGSHNGRGVRLLDGFGWTRLQCDGYDDNIHHSRLAFDHVTAFLRQECQI